ncbi:hypothetical protein C1H46_017804 [Malus baccata]|uniref:GST N-terminal domain-containing protein n=1 Tax=Malus baccata TaxID=106549 RepID=A0A540MCX7_MALBA|nr:hypothetical protein C1H46_017804 [Malus baccata]
MAATHLPVFCLCFVPCSSSSPSGGDPSQERNFTLEVATSSLSTLARFPWGSRSLSNNMDSQEITTLDPPLRLQLFEFEACPFCRRVREALTELDLSVEVYPCPKGSVRHREMVKRFGGKELFPFLIDPNTGRGLTLWEKASPDPPPIKLELYSYENNPYARIVREALCELELPYILQNVGEGSLRSKLLEASGSKEVPYLIDPNTGTHVGDYKKILSYLFKTYSAATLV